MAIERGHLASIVLVRAKEPKRNETKETMYANRKNYELFNLLYINGMRTPFLRNENHLDCRLRAS